MTYISHYPIYTDEEDLIRFICYHSGWIEDIQDDDLQFIVNDQLCKSSQPSILPILPPEPILLRFYRELQVTRDFHRSPRFRGGNDLAVVIHGTDQEKRAYRRGYRSFSTFAYVVFAIWVILLMVHRILNKSGVVYKVYKWIGKCFKTCRRKGKNMESEQDENDNEIDAKEGENLELNTDSKNEAGQSIKFTPSNQVEIVHGDDDIGQPNSTKDASSGELNMDTSGHHDTKDTASDDASPDESIEQNRRKRRFFCSRLLWFRLLFYPAALLMIAFTSFLIVRGFRSLHSVIQSLQVDIPKLESLLRVIQANTASSAAFWRREQALRNETLFSLVGSCDGQILDVLNLTVEEADHLVNATSVFFQNNVTTPSDFVIDLNKALKDVVSLLSTVDRALKPVEKWWYYPVAIIFILMCLIGILWMLRVSLAWHAGLPRLTRKKQHVTLPVFFGILIFGFVFSAVCLNITTVSSDYCVVSPDVQVYRMFGVNYFVEQFLIYYIEGCQEEDKPNILIRLVEALFFALLGIARLLQAISDAIERGQLPSWCSEDLQAIQYLLRQLSIAFEQHLRLAMKIAKELDCPTVYDIYSHLSYQTVCNDTIQATSEIFGYLFSSTVCAMLLVTFLVVGWNKKDDNDDSNKKDSGRFQTSMKDQDEKHNEEESERLATSTVKDQDGLQESALQEAPAASQTMDG